MSRRDGLSRGRSSARGREERAEERAHLPLRRLLPPRRSRLNPLEQLQHPRHALLEVERAEVEPSHAVLEQSLHHLDREVDAVLLDGGVVVLCEKEGSVGREERERRITNLNSLEIGGDVGRDVGAAEVGHAAEGEVVLNRHDTGKDGDCDACSMFSCQSRSCEGKGRSERTSSPASVVPLHEHLDVIEQLRHDEIRAGFLLLIEVLDIVELVRRVRMSLRVACSSYVVSYREG